MAGEVAYFSQNLTFAAKRMQNRHTQVCGLRNSITKDESLQVESNVVSRSSHLLNKICKSIKTQVWELQDTTITD